MCLDNTKLTTKCKFSYFLRILLFQFCSCNHQTIYCYHPLSKSHIVKNILFFNYSRCRNTTTNWKLQYRQLLYGHTTYFKPNSTLVIYIIIAIVPGFTESSLPAEVCNAALFTILTEESSPSCFFLSGFFSLSFAFLCCKYLSYI